MPKNVANGASASANSSRRGGPVAVVALSEWA